MPVKPFLLAAALAAIPLAASTPVTRPRTVLIRPSDAGALADRIIGAYNATAKKVILEPGVYHIKTAADEKTLVFRGMSDFEIDGSGAILIFADRQKGGVWFDNCKHVTVRGVTIRYEPLPFTQGLIETIAPDGSWYDLQMDEGYPDLGDPAEFAPSPSAEVVDRKTSWLKAGAVGVAFTRVERAGLGKYRVYRRQSSGPHTSPAEIGDKMVFRGLSGRPAITVSDCDQMFLDGITINSSPSATIVETGGPGGNHYSHITIRRGPKPEGATAAPLISSLADGLHSSAVRRGPTVENCYFEGMLDDGIAVHGTYSVVLEAHGAELIVANNSHFEPGDSLRLYDAHDGPVAEAKVLSVTPVEGYKPQQKTSRKFTGDIALGPYFRLRLDHAIPAGFDFLAANGNALGSGYRLRDNTIRYHRARGMLLKADDGLVENNRIEGSTIGGIVITPEFEWAEADYSRNIVIRNNTVKNVGYYGSQVGAISLAAWDTDDNQAVPSAGHQNIIIEGNTVSDVNGVNLAITSAKDVVVKGNRFIRPHLKDPRKLPIAWNMDPSVVIWLTQCSGIHFEGNTVSDVGPFAETIIDKTATAQTLGEEDGVKVTRWLK